MQISKKITQSFAIYVKNGAIVTASDNPEQNLVCLKHASSLILTCFEYDLGMFESFIQVRILHRLC